MRFKKIENDNGTWSLYNQTEKRFVAENKSKKEIDELKKTIDWHRKNSNERRNGG